MEFFFKLTGIQDDRIRIGRSSRSRHQLRLQHQLQPRGRHKPRRRKEQLRERDTSY